MEFPATISKRAQKAIKKLDHHNDHQREQSKPKMTAEKPSLKGDDLISELSSLTGIHETGIKGEIKHIFSSNGAHVEDLTLENLRAAMLEYLEQFAPADIEAMPPLPKTGIETA